jgi:hypothetical protein
MGVFRLTSLAAVGLAAVGLATAADARRVTVDGLYPYELGGCSLDFNLREMDLCQPVNLGFTIGVTEVIDEEFGDIVERYSSIVLYDDGLISFGGVVDTFIPEEIVRAEWPVVAVQFELQDFQPSGQFVSSPSEVIRGPGTFEAFWYNANVLWNCTEFDEDDEFLCLNGFISVQKQPPHARLLIESLPGDGARFTLSWTEGARSFGYSLGTDVRELGGAGERMFQFIIGTSQPVPEPATWAMMIAGFGLVGAAARKRRRLSAA